jgi:SnoaL-like domain
VALKGITMQKYESSAKISAKEIVMEYLQAVERRDFKSARSYLSDNISYVSPVNSFDRAEPYLKYYEHQNVPPLDIKEEFADSNDVCLLSEVTYREPTVTIFVCVWYHVNDDDKISSIRMVFDPRPFVQDRK